MVGLLLGRGLTKEATERLKIVFHVLDNVSGPYLLPLRREQLDFGLLGAKLSTLTADVPDLGGLWLVFQRLELCRVLFTALKLCRSMLRLWDVVPNRLNLLSAIKGERSLVNALLLPSWNLLALNS